LPRMERTRRAKLHSHAVVGANSGLSKIAKLNLSVYFDHADSREYWSAIKAPPIHMRPHLPASRSIEDIWHPLSWDSTHLAVAVSERAVALSQLGIGCCCVVAIADASSAYFLADPFAVWTLGATAACLDNSLTPVNCAPSWPSPNPCTVD